MPATLKTPPSRWTAGSKTIELRKALERCTPRPELTHAQPQVTGLLTLVVKASPFRLPVALCAPRRTVKVCLLPSGLEPFVLRPKKIWADGAYGAPKVARNSPSEQALRSRFPPDLGWLLVSP